MLWITSTLCVLTYICIYIFALTSFDVLFIPYVTHVVYGKVPGICMHDKLVPESFKGTYV